MNQANLEASARAYMRSLGRNDPARAHLSALLDVVSAQRCQMADDGMKMARMHHRIRELSAGAEETQRIVMLPAQSANGGQS